jgi:1-acyl-sn-glycerol-3-phosphate acyltransferase
MMRRFLSIAGHTLLRNWVVLAIRVYFRKIQVIGSEKIPRSGPVLFAPNHQYAFMDALIITIIDRKIPYYLVRGDIFRTRLANFMLRSLRMMPVYRAKDKVDMVKKNEEIFDKCMEILGSFGHLIIFPEGNHSKIRRIRPVQKGIFRIAFRTLLEKQGAQDLVIIPVGINYDDQSHFQSDLLVNFGNPIKVSQYLEEYKQSSARVIGELKNKIFAELVRLNINIENAESYKFYENIIKIYSPHFMLNIGESYNNLEKRFNAYHNIITRLDKFKNESEEEFREFMIKCNKFFKRQSRQKLNPAYISGRSGSGMGKLHRYIALVIVLPVYYYGVINHAVALAIPYLIGKFLVRDDHFESSVKIAVGLLSFPLAYAINLFIVYVLTNRLDWTIYYFISMIITGIFAKISQSYVKSFWEKLKFWTVKYTDPVDYVKIKKNFREIRKKLDKRVIPDPKSQPVQPGMNSIT